MQYPDDLNAGLLRTIVDQDVRKSVNRPDSDVAKSDPQPLEFRAQRGHGCKPSAGDLGALEEPQLKIT